MSKKPMLKIHLLDSNEPVEMFGDVKVRCGTVLKNALPKFMVAEELQADMTLPLSTCRKCLENYPVGNATRYYVYGLVEAAEEKLADGEWEMVS